MIQHAQESIPGHAISREELREGLADGSLTLLDVLPSASYEDGHIPGAVSLPLAEIDATASMLLPDRARPIAVYCGSFT